jgi:hypothetical protein
VLVILNQSKAHDRQNPGFAMKLADISGIMRGWRPMRQSRAEVLPDAMGGGPMNIHIKDDVSERTLEIVAELKQLEGPLLPILHALQHDYGYVPEAALPLIWGRRV